MATRTVVVEKPKVPAPKPTGPENPDIKGAPKK